MNIDNVSKAKDLFRDMNRVAELIEAINESKRPCEFVVTEVFGNVHIKYLEDSLEKGFVSIKYDTFKEVLMEMLKTEYSKIIEAIEIL